MKNWHLTVLGILLVLILAEIGARIYVAYRWPDEKVLAFTRHAAEKGHYSSHPYLPYIPRSTWTSPRGDRNHNNYGFRGKEFDAVKPAGVFRIVAIGASTTYGVLNTDENTYPAQLERIIRDSGYENVEVLNAGVTLYNSTETFLNFYLRILNLAPDMVIYYQARNEIFPQAFNHYAHDLTHYRQSDYSFAKSNYFHKYLFRVSHLFMGLATRRGGSLGWSARNENPNYGTIRYENSPTSSELIDNLSQAEGLANYRRNIESIIHLARQNGDIQVVLSTFAFNPDKYESWIIQREEAMIPAIAEQIEKMNDVVRQIAAEQDLVLVDTARELAPRLHEYLLDDCHFNDIGQQARAALIFRHIEQDLPPKSSN